MGIKGLSFRGRGMWVVGSRGQGVLAVHQQPDRRDRQDASGVPRLGFRV